MRHQAALLEHIVRNQRYYPDYFRVAFYGNFPVAIRNKQFIVCSHSPDLVAMILIRLVSIVVSSGKNLGRFVNAC
jgi:hypothetical protein